MIRAVLFAAVASIRRLSLSLAYKIKFEEMLTQKCSKKKKKNDVRVDYLIYEPSYERRLLLHYRYCTFALLKIEATCFRSLQIKLNAIHNYYSKQFR
uniref:Putative secreted protein n=1 Tax=Xenopsylla cheopis TaxID=163159 RepID=A0A6M2DZA7_XENCH